MCIDDITQPGNFRKPMLVPWLQVSGREWRLFFEDIVIDGQWNSWQESHWREAALLAHQSAVFITDGMAGNHCDSWPIIFMQRVTLSFQGKRPGTALNCTWLWLIAWEDKWWVGAWHQCCFEKSIKATFRGRGKRGGNSFLSILACQIPPTYSKQSNKVCTGSSKLQQWVLIAKILLFFCYYSPTVWLPWVHLVFCCIYMFFFVFKKIP